MVDKNQLKIADQADLADDDPFAELTRIMGFDPRQPAKQAAPVRQPSEVQPAAEAQEVAEDDFSLDLEKELLGGFDLEDEVSEPSAPVEAAAEAPVAAPEPEVHEFEAPAPEAAEVDFDFSADFDAAMAASTEAEAPVEPEAEFDLDLTEDEVRAFDVGATGPEEASQPDAAEAEEDFDLGLTEDDVRALDLEAFPHAAPVEAEVAPVPVTDDKDIDADIDAAMADIDMDFLRDVRAPEPAMAAPAEEPVEAVQDDAASEVDLHLFDEGDFRLEDEPAPAIEFAPSVEAEPQPVIDESAFSFAEDELRLDDAPAEEQAAQPAEDAFSFDDVDFAAEEFTAPEPQAVVEEPAVAAEPSFSHRPSFADQAEPDPAPRFELPHYEPRKLPVSPMDVAAEEFRQREATAAPAEPEFNLEDELNALLGNIRAGQAAAPAETMPEPEPEPESAPAYEPASYEPAYEPPYEPAADSYQQPATSSSPYEPSGPMTGLAAYEPPRFAPVSFDAPEHPADIEDDLNWELDDAFTAEAAPEPVEEEPVEEDQAYAEEDQPETYAEDERYGAYAEAGQPEDVYARDFDAGEEPAPIDLEDIDLEDEAYDQPAEDNRQPAYSPYSGDALAGAAIGAAAASRFDSGFAARPFAAGASPGLSDLPRAPVRAPEHFAAPSGPVSFSPHRDPVVRGNPMKEDPLDIITALAAKYSKKEPVTPYGRAMGVASGSTPFADETADDEDIDISAAFEEQPDVETVEVADKAVAFADDLDIPELAEEEELPPASAYDDLDAEFSSLLSDMNAEPRAAQPAGYDDALAGGFNARSYQSQMAAPDAPRQAPPPARKVYDDDPEPDSFALDADDLPGSRMPSGGQYAADEYDYDPDIDQEMAAPHHMAAESRQQPKSRGMLLAAIVGGVALVGAIGAFALSFGDSSGGDAPAIVRADDGPVKVKPENPGGTTVPNQDNKVYDTVTGEGAADAPQQEKLVTTAEEPVDVTPPPPAMEETAAAPSGKGEDRIEQILQEAENQTDAEIVAVSPRKVRTMVVKPDGTLVEREGEPEAAAPSSEQTDTIAAAVPDAPAPAIPELPAIPESTGALPAASEAAPPPAAAPQETAAAAPLPPREEVAAAEPEPEDTGTMPETAPIAPLRPADQPVDVVGEVKPDQVAAATTATADGNSWAMQIASQPSQAAAQSSYQDLVRRYGSVLQGRDVNIVKAEITGKGTFWRVRVPATSRNEAIGLCENYKAAGGNCFVSR